MRWLDDIKKFSVKGFLDHKPPMVMDDGLIEKIAKAVVDKITKFPQEGKQDIKELLTRIAELQKQNDLLEKLSLTDPLTGAYNTRYFEKKMDEITESNMAQRNPTGRHFLMMVDLDGFKQINDAYGHETGDMALIHVVRKLNEMTRKTDAVCRVGGDEFVVILKDATEEGAKQKIMNIADTFNTMSFDKSSKKIPVRASIGWSELKPDEFVKDVMRRIDEYVYDSKKIKGDTRFTDFVDCHESLQDIAQGTQN